MAKLNKKGVSILLVILVIASLISLTMFSCTVQMAQNDTYVDMSEAHLLQLETPSDEDPAMIVHTSVGDITAVLYPEAAPNYVAQFTELAEKGYYDGTYVYETQDGAYFRAGSPNEDGSLDDQLDESRQKVETELTADLWSFRGAFCAPVTETENNFFKMLFGNNASYCGTRFLVCNSIVFDEETKQQMQETDESAAAVTDAFLSWGGVPDCSQQMTIFAQAYGKESFEVIDAISNSTLSEESICIEKIEITNWGKTNKDTFVPENSV